MWVSGRSLVHPRLPMQKDVQFADLALLPELLAILERCQYHRPTPIQAELIPLALAGRDVVGIAQTGTGKTAAFLLPILQHLERHAYHPQALILGPTRELVLQIAQEARKLSAGLDIRCAAILGGERYRGQLQALRQGVQMVIGTPGRLIDHIYRGTLDLQRLRFVVLDEADRMLDIGFRPDIERILRRCPVDRQTLLLSATVPPPVMRLCQRYMREPLTVDVTPPQAAVASIRQTYISVAEEDKFDLLMHLIEREQPRQCIIFTATRKGAEELFRDLYYSGVPAAVLHGDLPQSKRLRIMTAFREGRLRFLVATDVVSRGIDVVGISHIFNYDLPEDPENYVHRIGRTGRMGRDGVAIAFVTPQQGKQLTAIEMLQDRLIEEERIPGFSVERAATAAEAAESTPPGRPRLGQRVRRYSRW